MIGLFLYTQIETQRAQKKIKELSDEGKTVGRELSTSKVPSFFQSIKLYPSCAAVPPGWSSPCGLL